MSLPEEYIPGETLDIVRNIHYRVGEYYYDMRKDSTSLEKLLNTKGINSCSRILKIDNDDAEIIPIYKWVNDRWIRI